MTLGSSKGDLIKSTTAFKYEAPVGALLLYRDTEILNKLLEQKIEVKKIIGKSLKSR